MVLEGRFVTFEPPLEAKPGGSTMLWEARVRAEAGVDRSMTQCGVVARAIVGGRVGAIVGASLSYVMCGCLCLSCWAVRSSSIVVLKVKIR